MLWLSIRLSCSSAVSPWDPGPSQVLRSDGPIYFPLVNTIDWFEWESLNFVGLHLWAFGRNSCLHPFFITIVRPTWAYFGQSPFSFSIFVIFYFTFLFYENVSVNLFIFILKKCYLCFYLLILQNNLFNISKLFNSCTGFIVSYDGSVYLLRRVLILSKPCIVWYFHSNIQLIIIKSITTSLNRFFGKRE